MSTLFIYFSHSGNGDAVAEYLSEKGVICRKVQPRKPLPKSFFWSIMTGGFLAMIGHKSKLVDFDRSLEGVDRIVIGSPVWNGRLSCPINALLAEMDFGELPVSFLLYAGSGEALKAEKRLRKEYPLSPVLVIKEPKKYPEELAKSDILLE